MSSNEASSDQMDKPTITPVEFVPPEQQSQRRKLSLKPWQLAVGGVALLLLLCLAFVFTARSVQFAVQPTHAKYEISGGWQIQVGDRHLMMPGSYRIKATAEGYHPFDQVVSISKETNQSLPIELRKLPGILSLEVTPAEALLSVDSSPFQTSPSSLELEPGTRQLEFRAERYFSRQTEIEIEGMGVEQGLVIMLDPAWGTLGISSDPEGAELRVDGEPLGTTPLQAEILQGEHKLSLHLPGYNSAELLMEVTAGEQRQLRPFLLRKADASLTVNSSPSGAGVMLNGQFKGRTPLTLAATPDQLSNLELFLAGYHTATLQFTLTANETSSINVNLQAETGTITITPEPVNAEILVNGRSVGRGKQTLTLPSRQQLITARLEGYGDQKRRITPKPGRPQQLAIRLKTLEQLKWENTPTVISTPVGQSLRLLRPGNFTMGASRREPGRRANEVMRKVAMERAFYLAEKEVTNAEFRRFLPGHSSGNFEGKSLNGEQQPAVRLSWEQAARYCNWLSKEQGLPPFYLEEEGQISGFDPNSTGYRLPSEAEWAWSARVDDSGAILKFPWGSGMPPPERTENYADDSARQILGRTLPNYNDRQPVTAPVGSYPANRHGLYDLGGNVAEWVHDQYGSLGTLLTRDQVDPLGPEEGEFHVIRGASWRHGSVVELRLSFRDYGKEPRQDVGFRVARYLE